MLPPRRNDDEENYGDADYGAGDDMVIKVLTIMLMVVMTNFNLKQLCLLTLICI